MTRHYQCSLLLLFMLAPAVVTALAGSTGGSVKFEDPFERAFTLDVPTGWVAKGGLFRLGFDDWRPMVDLRFPDGAINIRMGDVAVPRNTVPVPYHMTEGEPYDLGAQAVMTVGR